MARRRAAGRLGCGSALAGLARLRDSCNPNRSCHRVQHIFRGSRRVPARRGFFPERESFTIPRHPAAKAPRRRRSTHHAGCHGLRQPRHGPACTRMHAHVCAVPQQAQASLHTCTRRAAAHRTALPPLHSPPQTASLPTSVTPPPRPPVGARPQPPAREPRGCRSTSSAWAAATGTLASWCVRMQWLKSVVGGPMWASGDFDALVMLRLCGPCTHVQRMHGSEVASKQAPSPSTRMPHASCCPPGTGCDALWHHVYLGAIRRRPRLCIPRDLLVQKPEPKHDNTEHRNSHHHLSTHA